MITTTPNAPHVQPPQVNNHTEPSQTPADLPRQKSPKYRNHHQPLIPGLPYNPGVERYVSRATEGFKTASQSTSDIIRAELKKRWGKDIDPDNTFITTFNYDPKQRIPKGGKVLNQISLTEAALHNMRHKNTKNEHQTPDEKQQSTLHTWLNRLAPLAAAPIAIYNIVHTINEPKTYEGIFVGAPPGSRQVYNETTQLKQTPEAFRDITWNTDQSKPYTEFLNGFWPAHEQKYAQLSKAAFVGAAMAQFDNDSLSENDVSLAMRAAGLPKNKTWLGLNLQDLDAAPHKDPNVETGLLKINGFKSTNLMYITDKQTKTTLLHIPGNSSPIHRFDSQEQMKNWLAEQAADPQKREALSMHFPLRDQADRTLSEGVNQTLVGISGWPKKDAADATFLERLNQYDPQTFITTEPLTEDPFKVMTTRQKERSYLDAETEITTDADVTKTTILEALETATKIAVMMTPLALVMPEVAIALEVFYVASGAAEIGIGADNIKHGKKGGSDQVVFGVLNALPVAVGGAGTLAKEVETGEVAVGKDVEEAIKPDVQVTPEESVVVTPEVDPIRPSQAGNISAHARPNGEQLLDGRQPNSKGIYQRKDASGVDQWLIRYTDDSGVSKVYEIQSGFKLSDDYVRIIDPLSRKPVMTVHATGDGEWARVIGAGGGRKWPWERTQSPTPSEELRIPQRFSTGFTKVLGADFKGAEKLDEVLTFQDQTRYEHALRNFKEEGVLKRELSVSWSVDDGDFAVSEGEAAQPVDNRTTPYSYSFLPDLDRDNYTVITRKDGVETRTKLDARGASTHETRDQRLDQFEVAITDPALRSRISEVAHQGSILPAWKELLGPVMKDGYAATTFDKHYFINHDAATGVTEVKQVSRWKVVDQTGDESKTVPGVEFKTTRTFTIRPSSDVGSNGYSIDPAAPTDIQAITVNNF